MIELVQNQLVFSFPEIHPDARCTIEFQRTLRLPDDNKEYPLPPGLGKFPLMHVDDLEERLPEAWEAHGGIFFPMYQTEAMWINFDSDYPFAIKVADGKINAITGDSWSNQLHADPQDYLIIPKQPWLDGFCIAKGKIRQFVAMPLGDGYTAEEQLTGAAKHGGIQIIAYPMKLEVYQQLLADRSCEVKFSRSAINEVSEAKSVDMGLAPGGLMRQEIYQDYHGIRAWDISIFSRCYVHITNSRIYHELTGNPPPTNTPTARDYTEAGLPWFDHYDEQAEALLGKPALANLDSVTAMGIKNNESPLPENESCDPKSIKNLSIVREGKFW
jgi:hypothetical protein